MPNEEMPLIGGNVTPVVRIRETVRRAMGPWSPAVHGLLRYLEAHGFDAAPRILGLDDKGREILTYIPGEVGQYPLPSYMWTDESLTAAARLLRRFHDATIGYVPPPGAMWQIVYPDRQPCEVICHNDFAPYNLVFVDRLPRALIDFDTAGPGPRIWDIAYAVFRFVPLSDDGPWESRGRRLRLFCDAYGLGQRQHLLRTVERRLEVLCATIIERAASGDLAWRHMLEQGHLDHYRRCITFIQRHYTEWRRAL